ncbi:MAG: acyltransferase family protein, partial [Candidatus Acidiferrales bacterium]
MPLLAFDMNRPSKYIPELDGLHGIAVLMVIFHHISQNVPGFTRAGSSGRLVGVWLRITTPGWLGVDIFFVLSGFLITGILLDTKGRPRFYRNFYMKRILRIFPMYYLTLVIMLPFYSWPWPFFGLSAAYLSNVSVLFGVPMVLAPLWSLYVEEHFYFLWPWVIRFLSVRAVFIAAITIVLLEPVFRAYAFQYGFFDPYFS